MNAAHQPCCRSCGQPIPDVPRLDQLIVALGLSGNERRVFNFLAAARGRYLSNSELIELLWMEDPELEPVNAEKQVAVIIHRLRKKLAAFQVKLQSHGAEGRSGSRLIWSIDRPTGIGSTRQGWGYQLVKKAA